MRKHWLKMCLFLAGVFILLILPRINQFLFGSTYVTELLVQVMIFATCSFSLNLLLGYMKHAPLGHGVYLGIAAYTVAICVVRYNMGNLTASLLAILIGTFAAALFGLFALRARGVYFMMITLAIAMLVWGLSYRWTSISGGDNGISGIHRPVIGPWSLESINSYYYLVLLVFAVCMFTMMRIIQSPFGQTVVGIRESESRMRTLGYNSWLHRYICFVIAGFFSAVSGVLFIFYNGYISPPSLELLPNIEVLLMTALGGPGTVAGPLLGAIVIIFMKNLVSAYASRYMILLGIIYIVTVLYTPRGLIIYFPVAWEKLTGIARRTLGMPLTSSEES